MTSKLNPEWFLVEKTVPDGIELYSLKTKRQVGFITNEQKNDEIPGYNLVVLTAPIYIMVKDYFGDDFNDLDIKSEYAKLISHYDQKSLISIKRDNYILED